MHGMSVVHGTDSCEPQMKHMLQRALLVPFADLAFPERRFPSSAAFPHHPHAVLPHLNDRPEVVFPP
jgi:hypothetical protein